MDDGTERPAIDVGADVSTSDGAHVGRVAYVVVRPPAFTITDVVVSTGALLGRDIVVPVDSVAGREGNAVRLALDRHALDTLPDYVEAHYERPPDDWFGAAGMYYPGSGTLWPAGTYFPVPTSTTVNAPAGTVGLREGLDVVSSDGHGVGRIHRLVTDGAGEEVAALVVTEGVLFRHDVTIPTTEIEQATEAGVVLRLTRDEVKERFEER